MLFGKLRNNIYTVLPQCGLQYEVKTKQIIICYFCLVHCHTGNQALGWVIGIVAFGIVSINYLCISFISVKMEASVYNSLIPGVKTTTTTTITTVRWNVSFG